ncbi:hypothetical protein STEG23_024223, partial [Scotinomys teguina]
MPRLGKNAHSRWDGHASVSAVPECLDALVQEPLTDKTAADSGPKREGGKFQETVAKLAELTALNVTSAPGSNVSSQLSDPPRCSELCQPQAPTTMDRAPLAATPSYQIGPHPLTYDGYSDNGDDGHGDNGHDGGYGHGDDDDDDDNNNGDDDYSGDDGYDGNGDDDNGDD